MVGKGREHFDSYTDRTRIKHAILEKYLRAYVVVLKSRVDAIHYIDAFAGEGVYAGSAPGSPLRAISLLAELNVPSVVTLIESRTESFARLQQAVKAHADTARLKWKPVLIEGEFGGHTDKVLADPVYQPDKSVATFAFIDPCGVKGVRIGDISQVLRLPYGECLILWNYSGVIRWLGAAAGSSEHSEDLKQFFGGADQLKKALEIHRSARSSEEKESLLRGLFFHSLHQQSGAEYFLPFRFDAPDANRTSHYLLHCSGYHLGFRIMKEIMDGEGSHGGDVGKFEFVREVIGESLPLFFPQRERAREAILQELARGERSVKLFYEDWVNRPGDYMTMRQYKEILLELEREGRLEVVDARTGMVKPPAKRMQKGQVTLGETRLIRLMKSP